MNIEQSYYINEQTVAIIPAKEIDYDSIIIEKGNERYVRETPLNIIKASCLENWSTYEGRRKAVMHQTGYKEKVPIPIHLKKEIIAFPTHAIKHFDCCWLFYQHVFHYESINDHPEFTSIYG